MLCNLTHEYAIQLVSHKGGKTVHVTEPCGPWSSSQKKQKTGPCGLTYFWSHLAHYDQLTPSYTISSGMVTSPNVAPIQHLLMRKMELIFCTPLVSLWSFLAPSPMNIIAPWVDPTGQIVLSWIYGRFKAEEDTSTTAFTMSVCHLLLKKNWRCGPPNNQITWCIWSTGPTRISACMHYMSQSNRVHTAGCNLVTFDRGTHLNTTHGEDAAIDGTPPLLIYLISSAPQPDFHSSYSYRCYTQICAGLYINVSSPKLWAIL